MPPIDLETIIGIALAAAIITQALRSTWPIVILVEKEVKPFACDLCMSIWSTAAVGIAYFGLSEPHPEPLLFIVWTVLPAMGGALIAITMTNSPVFPDLSEPDDDEIKKEP